MQVLLASGYGALRHVGQRHVELPLVLFLTAGSVLGVQVGVRLAKRFRGPRIRCLFAGVMLLGMAVIVWDLGRRLLAGPAPWRQALAATFFDGFAGLTRVGHAQSASAALVWRLMGMGP